MREMKTEQTSARRRRLVFFSRSLPRWLPETPPLECVWHVPERPFCRTTETPRLPRLPARSRHVARTRVGRDARGCDGARVRPGRAAWGGASSDRAVALPRHRSCRRPNIRAAARSTRDVRPGVARPARARRVASARLDRGRDARVRRRDVRARGRRARDGADARDGRVRDGSGGASRERRRGRLDGRHRRDVRGDDRAPARFGREFLPPVRGLPRARLGVRQDPGDVHAQRGAAQRSRGARDARRRPRAQASVPEGLQERDQRAGGGAGVRPEPGPGGARGERRERGARRLRHTLRRARRRGARRRERRRRRRRQPLRRRLRSRALRAHLRGHRTRR